MRQYTYDISAIQQRIDRLTNEQRCEYPKHYYDPIRLQITHDLAIKEYYKLFPFMTEKQFDLLEDAMFDWFVGEAEELAPVLDYWNIIGSFTETLKLKELVFYLTSSNVSWSLETINVKQLKLRWGVGDLGEGEVRSGSWTYEDVEAAILNNPQRLKNNKDISDVHSNATSLNRDHFPIVVLQNRDDEYTLLDGNRRTMRAWLNGDDTIQAWTGRVVAEPILKDYWVSPSFLRRLLAEYSTDDSDEVLQSIRSQMQIVFGQSVVAKHHFLKRCLHIPGAKEIADSLNIQSEEA